MIVIYFPTTFKVGDTVDRNINSEPARVTYEDKDTLMINRARLIFEKTTRSRSLSQQRRLTEAELAGLRKRLYDGARKACTLSEWRLSQRTLTIRLPKLCRSLSVPMPMTRK